MSHPPPRPRPKSGRAPKSESYLPVETLDRRTLAALEAAVFVHNAKSTPNMGSKVRYLNRAASDLEIALLLKKPKDETDRLCLDVAATALRILEQGD